MYVIDVNTMSTPLYKRIQKILYRSIDDWMDCRSLPPAGFPLPPHLRTDEKHSSLGPTVPAVAVPQGPHGPSARRANSRSDAPSTREDLP